MKQKCATIVFLGVPNSGKSTLMNAILGVKVAAVHRKPQMTRKNQLGIYTDDQYQLIFLDTPGIHESNKKLNKRMLKEIYDAVDEADTVAVLLEVNQKPPFVLEKLLTQLNSQRKNIMILLNKIDLPAKFWVLQPDLVKKKYDVPVYMVSALKKTGIELLIETFKKSAGEHPFFYDSDDLTTSTYREIAADCIREKIMEFLHKEIPYETAVVIESYKENPKKIKIDAVIVVNQGSQKAIMLGKGGGRQ